MKRLYLRELILVALFAGLISVGAFIAIPLPYVPITLQVLFVFLAGAVLRPLAAVAATTIYVILGTIGLPVFAGGGAGISVLLGGSGGYLIGFIFAALVISWMVGARKVPIYQIISAMLIGLFIIYDLGMIRLAQVQSISLGQAFGFGVLPFILGDLIKLIIAALVGYKINQSEAFQTVLMEPEVVAASDEPISSESASTEEK